MNIEVLPPPEVETEYKITLTQNELEHLTNILLVGKNEDNGGYTVVDGDTSHMHDVKSPAVDVYNRLYDLLSVYDESTFDKSFEGYEFI